MRVSCVLLWPAMIALRRMALVLRHIVPLLSVRGIGWVGRTRRGNGGIYRYLGVRLHVWRVMMVILVSILQGHGRTCCLSHTCSTSVTMLLLLLLLLLGVMLSRQIIRVQVC